MLTAELLKPNRLNTQGRTWERGVQVPIDLTTARILSKNKRFQVNGLFEALEAIADGKTLEELGILEAPAPEGTDEPETETGEDEGGDEKSLSDRIREAADALDIDDESNFGNDGKPTVEALSKALGEEITAEQRDVAIAPPAKQGQLVAEEKPAGAPKRSIRIPSKPRPKKKPAPKPAAKPQAEEKSVEV